MYVCSYVVCVCAYVGIVMPCLCILYITGPCNVFYRYFCPEKYISSFLLLFKGIQASY